MNNAKIKPLTEKEMSQIAGGIWVKIEGEWIWVSAQKEETCSEIIRQIHKRI